MKVLVLLYLWMLELSGVKAGTHNFYRFMQNYTDLGTRRIFGGTKASLKDFPSICLLTDKYKAIVEDEGRGMDVTKLYHDIGLVETKEPMTLEYRLDMNPIEAMQKLPKNLMMKDVMVMGFGRTDSDAVKVGEELFSVKIRLLKCERSTWVHCVCGTSAPGEMSRGVCLGDSGGPVVMDGLQVGVTSMGPNECASMANLDSSSTSVFTLVSNYLDVINKTIGDTLGSSMKEMSLAKHGGASIVPENIFISIFLVCTWFFG